MVKHNFSSIIASLQHGPQTQMCQLCRLLLMLLRQKIISQYQYTQTITSWLLLAKLTIQTLQMDKKTLGFL